MSATRHGVLVRLRAPRGREHALAARAQRLFGFLTNDVAPGYDWRPVQPLSANLSQQRPRGTDTTPQQFSSKKHVFRQYRSSSWGPLRLLEVPGATIWPPTS